MTGQKNMVAVWLVGVRDVFRGRPCPCQLPCVSPTCRSCGRACLDLVTGPWRSAPCPWMTWHGAGGQRRGGRGRRGERHLLDDDKNIKTKMTLHGQIQRVLNVIHLNARVREYSYKKYIYMYKSKNTSWSLFLYSDIFCVVKVIIACLTPPPPLSTHLCLELCSWLWRCPRLRELELDRLRCPLLLLSLERERVRRLSLEVERERLLLRSRERDLRLKERGVRVCLRATFLSITHTGMCAIRSEIKKGTYRLCSLLRDLVLKETKHKYHENKSQHY